MRPLKDIKNILFLIAFCLTTSVFAQNESTKINFPISGLMKVQKNEQNEPKRYNYIDFKEDTYALMLDDENLFTFQAIALSNDEYVLKQLTYGAHRLEESENEKTDIRLKIMSLGVDRYELSFIFPNRIEKLILIKE